MFSYNGHQARVLFLKANPDYRGYTWNFKATHPEDQENRKKQMQGKKCRRLCG